MSEENQQKETEGEATETANPDTTPGSEPENINIIDRADSLNKGLDEKLKRFESITERFESAVSRQVISGHAPAGQALKSAEALKDEEMDKEVARQLKGFI